ncbi:uncharacterized protein LOC119104655 [Pollicipes pollicipes]|uniref:uncharacterized protein LOC119104655 n=1 Tax=Pollicipes pollicipes TaxID=41117 RepID=UPI001884CF28|nr:uncharacterized protein LOC119104655 [Pollicipes pollicipes]
MPRAHSATLSQLMFAAVAFIAAGQCSGEPRACGYACCTFLPDCTSPVSMNCDCGGLYGLQISRKSMQQSLEDVQITNAQTVIIKTGAIFDLLSLKTFKMIDIAYLTVENEGLKLQDGANLRELRIHHVNTLKLLDTALSGYWHHDVRVSIQHVVKLNMYEAAFFFTSAPPGPSVELKNVRELLASRNAFTAAIRQLSVVNVSMRWCSQRCFSGRVSHLELIGVRITTALTQCVNGGEGWEKLTILHSEVLQVHTDALYGGIREVIINSTNITRVEALGFHLNVTTLQIHASAFQNLTSHGLDVLATKSFLMKNTTVGTLQTSALTGVRVANISSSEPSFALYSRGTHRTSETRVIGVRNRHTSLH